MKLKSITLLRVTHGPLQLKAVAHIYPGGNSDDCYRVRVRVRVRYYVNDVELEDYCEEVLFTATSYHGIGGIGGIEKQVVEYFEKGTAVIRARLDA